MHEHDLRLAIIEHARAMNRLGINQGTSGNLSARCGDAMLITPSGTAYAAMRPESIALMPLAGADGEWSGPLRPSSEWRFHRDILRERDDIGAIVHTHAPYATALAMLRKPIPAAHYMIAAFGGPTLRCTDYAPFGTQELSDLAVAGLRDRHGVLLGSHGMIATGTDLEQAMWRAVELEALAKMYHRALLVGTPAILADEEVAVLVERFKSYGALDHDSSRSNRPKRI
ncbi:MAG TPA: class II aldolase/adducin family protein [Beijerinckiaceae bacterium]|jgi:L-fuculose-phosphate aldolase|nr:class II aldolase/adducin family protein [Beijerinckiaceae bacterium]